MSALDAALSYAERGWRVIPIAPGHKFPKGITVWQRVASADPGIIRGWFAEGGKYEHHGVGVVTGAESGIWVLDVDDRDALAELEAAYGKLPATYTVVTGSGGLHLYYAWHDAFEIRNNQSGKIAAGIDIRGEGGFVVAPPSVHPNGTPYALDTDAPDSATDTPGLIVALLEREEAPPEPVAPQKPAEDAGERPGDRWAAETDWSTILEADGCVLHHVDRSGERHWTRPGKDKKDGPSGTTGYTDNDNLKVFSSNWPHLEADGSYSKLGYLAETRFSGDHAAAATWLAENGYRSERPDGKAELEALVGAPVESGAIELPPMAPHEPEPDRPFQPLYERPELPDWPVVELPEFMRDHVVNVAARLQTPVDLVAQFALGALAAVCMGHVTVQRGTWTEPTNLYLWCALHSGGGKSPAEKAVIGPLREWEEDRQEKTHGAYRVERAKWEVLQNRAKEAQKNAVTGTSADADALMVQAVLEASVPEPMPFRLLADDATPAKLVQLLGSHQRIAIVSAEGGLFDTVTGQFDKRSSGPVSVDVYLKAWSGDTIQRDRVGSGERGPESVRITNPLLTVALAIQPSVIERYQATSPELRGRGFFARFMPSIPTSEPGHRVLSDDETEQTPEAARYADGLKAIASRLADVNLNLKLDPEASAMFKTWHDAVEAELRPGRRLFPLAEMAPKVRSSVMRTAALLAIADGAKLAVPADTMARAIRIGEYWLAHALVMERTADPLDAAVEEDLRLARKVAQWAERASDRGKPVWSPREALHGVRRSMPERSTVEALRPALDVLHARGWLRYVEGVPDDIGQRGRTVRLALTEGARGRVELPEPGTKPGYDLEPVGTSGPPEPLETGRTYPLGTINLSGVSDQSSVSDDTKVHEPHSVSSSSTTPLSSSYPMGTTDEEGDELDWLDGDELA